MSDQVFGRVPLESVVTAIKDGTHGTHTRVSQGVPLLSAKNVTSAGTVSWDATDARITESEYEQIHRGFKLQPDDLLLTIVGSLGRRAVFDGSKVTFQRSVAYIRPDKERVHARFLFHWFGHSEFQRELVRRSNSTAQAGLYLGELTQTPVPACPLLEQAKIAAVLDAFDATIRHAEAIIEKLKQIKQGLLHDLMTRGIDDNGELRAPQSEAPHLYRDSALGPIPNNWSAIPFSRLANFVNGNSFDAEAWTDHGLPIIRIQNLNGSNDFNFYAGPVNSKWHVVPGDLLFAWSGQRGMSFGPRLWPGPSGVLNQHIFKVAERTDVVSKRFLFEALRFRQGAVEDAAHGFKDSFLHVTRGELGSVVAGIPGAEEQQMIVRRIEAFETRATAEATGLSKLKAQKAGLMHDLLTGRVSVTPLLA